MAQHKIKTRQNDTKNKQTITSYNNIRQQKITQWTQNVRRGPRENNERTSKVSLSALLVLSALPTHASTGGTV